VQAQEMLTDIGAIQPFPSFRLRNSMRHLLITGTVISTLLSLGCANRDNPPAAGGSGHDTGVSATGGGTMNNTTGQAPGAAARRAESPAPSQDSGPAGTIASRPSGSQTSNVGSAVGTDSSTQDTQQSAPPSAAIGAGSSPAGGAQAPGGIGSASGTAGPNGGTTGSGTGNAAPADAAGTGTGPSSTP